MDNVSDMTFNELFRVLNFNSIRSNEHYVDIVTLDLVCVMTILSRQFSCSSLVYDNRGRIISYYSHNSEFIYNLSYLRNSNVLQQELYGSYRDYFANTEDLVYKFTYDKSNRLLSATNTAGSTNEYKMENTYDKDGNILTLKRYVDAGNMQDNFTYQYYSGTNKLSRVSGNVDQFRYDLNGNVTTDSVYNNFSISYDHRNLITELYHIDTLTSTRQYSYAARYWYDEAGNRVRKLTYRNAQIPPPQINDWANPGNGWTLLNNEHYVRGVDGKELATYSGNTLNEWYVWASDMVGKIKGNAKYFFFKDHLGSVRAVVDNNFNLISAVDYDMWGDKMQGRIYNGDSTKFGFTGKEEDDENLYDYFGARYYDSRIGRWGQVEPLYEKYPGISPYVYSLDNPLIIIDPNGKDPRRDQLVNYMDIVNLLESNVGMPTAFVLGWNFTLSDHSYVYTKDAGFLDMLHVMAGAIYTAQLKVIASDAKELIIQAGELVEIIQEIIGSSSAYDKEDPMSNLVGVNLGLLLDFKSTLIVTPEMVNTTKLYLESLNPLDKNDPSISSDVIYIPENSDSPLLENAKDLTPVPYRGEPVKSSHS